MSFPTHKSPKSKQRLSVKNAFNQHVPNLFAFVTTSIYVLPTPSTLMAQISESETKLKPLTASSQFFLQQAVQSSGRYFTWDHHQPVSLCGASVQHKHLKMLWKYSAGTRELYQRPFWGKPKPITWGSKDVVVDVWSHLMQKANDSSVLHTSKEFQYSEMERTFLGTGWEIPKLASTSGIKALDSLKWITKAASPKMCALFREGPCKASISKELKRETFHL